MLFPLAAIASGGRTAIITLAGSGIVYAWIASRGKRGGLFYLSVAAVSFFSLMVVSYISSRDPLAFFAIHTSARIDGSMKYIDYVNAHSPFWGLGLDAGLFLREQGIIPYGSPHNIFLDAFVTMGWAGLIVVVSFLVFGLVQLCKIFKNSADIHSRALLVATVCAVLLAGQAYLSIWSKHNMVAVSFYLFLALSFTEAKLHKVS